MATIHSYLVDLYGDASSDGVRARIDLLGQSGLVGTLRFYDPGAPPPADVMELDGRGVQMHLPFTAFAGALALLQHDSPVEVEIAGQHGRLYTRERERVGEAEGQ